MERYVEEFEQRVKSLFSSENFVNFDIVSFISNISIDFLEDLVSQDNLLSPQKLIEAPKYHCLKRFLKEGGVYQAFLKIAQEYWNLAHVQK